MARSGGCDGADGTAPGSREAAEMEASLAGLRLSKDDSLQLEQALALSMEATTGGAEGAHGAADALIAAGEVSARQML